MSGYEVYCSLFFFDETAAKIAVASPTQIPTNIARPQSN
jgi:hypothetical protein